MLTQKIMLLNTWWTLLSYAKCFIHKQTFAKSLPKFAPFLLELSSLLKSLILLNNKKSNTLLSRYEKFFPEATVWTIYLFIILFFPFFFFKIIYLFTYLCILFLISTLSCTANLKRHIELKHPASLSRYVQVNKKSKDTATASQNRSSTTQTALTMYSSGSAVFISQPQLDNLVLQNIVGELQFQC